ncbi:MAG TPA: class I SAM-dependent methyltransferase [Methylomirabilota bacterium]|nr:class I SAM-dependent methyltransferase [Methylomirabilota bacterium]
MTDLKLGEAFADREVASLYRYRAPYPARIFEILARLLVEPRTILDAGAGTGSLARELVEIAARVDALDPSPAMIDEGRRLPRGNDPRLRWLIGRAEDGPTDPPYGLITCGASIHWMDPLVTLPRFRAMLAPGARLAIVDTENVHPSAPYRKEVLEVIRRYEPLTDHKSTRDFLDDLVARGLLVIEGREAVPPMPFEQSIDEYLGFLGSTSTLNWAILGDRASAFEQELRGVLSHHGTERVRYDVVGGVAWGRPA